MMTHSDTESQSLTKRPKYTRKIDLQVAVRACRSSQRAHARAENAEMVVMMAQLVRTGPTALSTA